VGFVLVVAEDMIGLAQRDVRFCKSSNDA